ncbi:MAG TPA: hypothetical protein VF898_04990 [Chloroflexota bacterium]
MMNRANAHLASPAVEPARQSSASGIEGNARLTSLVGLALLVLLFVEGMTVLSVRGMLSIHVFVGLMLIPPLFLKTASTGYRFARYYLRNPRYRAAGPPQIVLRVIAPVMLACTVGLFGTGVVLLLVGPQGSDPWRGLHQLFFFSWFGFMTIHVLAHTPRAARLGFSDLPGWRSGNRIVPGVMTRQSLVVGSIILGIVVAVVFLPLDSSWLQWASRFRFDQ